MRIRFRWMLVTQASGLALIALLVLLGNVGAPAVVFGVALLVLAARLAAIRPSKKP